MTKAHESFSAFLDGEASELDIQRMLKTMSENPEALHQWHDLSKVHAGMQGDVIVDTALEFTDTDIQAPAEKTSRFRFRLMQGGIAAAVAMVVVSVVNLNQPNTPDVEVVKAVVTTGQPSIAGSELAQQQFEAQQRLDLFLREHAEQASFTTGHAVVPADLEWVEATE
ncbi:MAG: sigma-E factor negative regulatory protein [Reinekea sp.]|nr:sigma-E factor negative regulatory protein [Reinekea sp.]